MSTRAPTACDSTHQPPPPHHLCVILNYRPFSIFIWTRAPLESFAGPNSAKVLFDHTNNLQLVQRCLLNKYLIRKILAFRAELFIVWVFWGWSWKRKHFCFNIVISCSKAWDFKGGPDRGNNHVWQINKPLLRSPSSIHWTGPTPHRTGAFQTGNYLLPQHTTTV